MEAKIINIKGNYTKELMDLAEEIQGDCNEAVKQILAENKDLSYQDATNVFIYTKLAQLQLLMIKLNDIG